MARLIGGVNRRRLERLRLLDDIGQFRLAEISRLTEHHDTVSKHNQRGYVALEIRSLRGHDGLPELIWFEELIELAEQSASAPVFPLLKRADERFITMQAYDNPVFVEDIVRNAAQRLRDDERIRWFRVHAENQESIHNHNAFARIEWLRPVPNGRD